MEPTELPGTRVETGGSSGAEKDTAKTVLKRKPAGCRGDHAGDSWSVKEVVMSRINDQYTDTESAFARSFTTSGTCCQVTCQCGRTYFVTADGHGDYREGEMEELLTQATKADAKTFACSQFDCIDLLYIGTKAAVIQCECGLVKKYIDWIEDNIEALVAYLAIRLQDRKKAAEQELKKTQEMIVSLESK